MREHGPKQFDRCKIEFDDLEKCAAEHKGLFNPNLPLFEVRNTILKREFFVMLVAQRKYVPDHDWLSHVLSF